MGWNDEDWEGDGPTHAGDIMAGSTNDQPDGEVPHDDEEAVLPPTSLNVDECHAVAAEDLPPAGPREMLVSIWEGNGKYVIGLLLILIVGIIIYKWRKQ